MNRYARAHFADPTLLTAAETHAGQERVSLAELLADLAEIDVRKLYLPLAYRSLHEYCTAKLRLSEDAAAKRIHAARTARRFPVIFAALAEGRLHLTGVCLLAAHLTEDNAAGLLEAAMGRSKLQIEQLLAACFPKSGLLPWVMAIPASGAPPSTDSHAPGHVNLPPTPRCAPPAPAPESHSVRTADLPRVTPLSGQSWGMQLTISTRAYDTLQHLQDLLGASPADVGRIFEDALDLYLAQVEKRKRAATERPSRRPRATRSVRHVPAAVRRAVYQRDGGRCAFVSEGGRRCSARRGLQLDHIEPVARGGESTVSNLRLLCRPHNQHRADQTFGAEFMRHKRLAGAGARAADKANAATRLRELAAEAARAQAAAEDPERSVIPWLRAWGYCVSEARRAAASCTGMPEASLEERVSRALAFSCRIGTRTARPYDREPVVPTRSSPSAP